MKLQQSFDAHKDDRPAKKNNAFFAENKVVCCLKTPDLEPDPFKDGQFRWAVPVIYRDEGGRQGGKWTFASDPSGKGKWDAIFGEADEYPVHNARLRYNVEGNAQKGYWIEFLDLPEAACSCKQLQKPNTPRPAVVIEEVTTEEVSALLEADGFEAVPVIPATKKAIRILSVALRQPVPEGLDSMTEAQGQDVLDQLQKLQSPF